MDDRAQFAEQTKKQVAEQGRDAQLAASGQAFLLDGAKHDYTYHFTWCGLPIIKFPQDMIAMQEIIWQVKPDLIIEAGVARGGSIIFLASMIELLGGNRKVVGIDIDIREHNRKAIEAHPLYKNVILMQDSSTSEQVIASLKKMKEEYPTVLVILDSCHSHDHVLNELKLYSELVTKGSYLIVEDTIIELLCANGNIYDRPWGLGSNPMTAIEAFMKDNEDFVTDLTIDDKLIVSESPKGGYLKKIR